MDSRKQQRRIVRNREPTLLGGRLFLEKYIFQFLQIGLEKTIFRGIDTRRMVHAHHPLARSNLLLDGKSRLFGKPHHAAGVNLTDAFRATYAVFPQVLFVENVKQLFYCRRREIDYILKTVVPPCRF